MTREQAALRAAGTSLAQAQDILYGFAGHTVEQAAALALTPTGPSLDELIDLIRQQREQALAA